MNRLVYKVTDADLFCVIQISLCKELISNSIMQTLQIQLPDSINIETQEIQLLLASRLYEKGLLSVGQAAQMTGLSKRTFMELLGRYQVSVLNYPAEDIMQDFENA
jgi:predicted HTH domain antitoxin